MIRIMSLRRLLRPVAAALLLVGAALTLGGCTKCGWIWNDWTGKTQSCRADAPVK
jgi:hypothetical protein